MAIVRSLSTVTEDEKSVEPLAPPLGTPVGGEIETKTFNLFSTDDDSHHAGTWDCAVGLSEWHFSDGGEVIYVTAGKMTVTREGEEPQEISAGDLAIFPQGWKGTWNVTEPLSKIYVMYS